MSWSVDGVMFDLPCNIERIAELTSSEISGMMMNGNYYNDVIGLYYRYRITVAIPRGMEDEYEYLYDMLTSPQDAHLFNLPYGYISSGINLTARVETISDSWVRLPNNKQTWRKTTFEIIANHPSKEADGTMHGMTPMPEAPNAPVGALYEKTANGWTQRTYENADGKDY